MLTGVVLRGVLTLLVQSGLRGVYIAEAWLCADLPTCLMSVSLTTDHDQQLSPSVSRAMSESQSYMVTIAPNPINPRKTLIPPLRFAIVETNVYRGSYPRPLNFPFLESLKLKTILSLTPAPPIEPVAEWGKQQGIKMIHHTPDKSGKKSIPLSHQDVKSAIEVCDSVDLILIRS